MSGALKVRVFGDGHTLPAVVGTLSLAPGLLARPLAAGRPLAGLLAFRGCEVAHGVMASASPKVFARAKRAGCLTVNHWIGTDVFETRRRPDLREALPRTPVDLHLAVAPWLCEELGQLGVEAREFPIVPPDLRPRAVPLPSRHAVLAYAGEGREDFYGVPALCELARSFPSVPFRLCGGGRLGPGAPANVEALGRLDPGAMEALYERSSVLVRLAEHDGLSKMVLDALARGREAVWNHPFEGARLAAGMEAARGILGEIFSAPPRLNERGWAPLRGPYSPAAVAARAEALYRSLLDPATRRK